MMLSRLLRFTLLGVPDPGRLRDLVIDTGAAGQPPVTHLVAQQGRHEPRVIPWSDVAALDSEAGTITLVEATTDDAPPIDLAEATLLRRDVLDAVIIDLEARRPLLANDLWLEQRGRRLRLTGVDASGWGIMRRLTLGLIDGGSTDARYDWRYVTFLRGRPRGPETGEKQERIACLPPGEIAHLVETLPYLHAAELVRLLPERLGADVLEAMSPERQLQVFEELSDERGTTLLADMAPDAAADLVGHLQPETARQRLEELPLAHRERIIDLLRYPEDTAGGIMTNDIVCIPYDITVAEARTMLRERIATPDLVYYAYVVDDDADRRLRGVITLRNILTASDEQVINDVMDPYLVTIHPLEPAMVAAQRVVDNQLFALPVIDHAGRVLGAVTVDAAVAQAAPAGWRNRAPKVFS